jgi:hypothetical protein
MKHLLTGVAIAAALAISAPVWAQNVPGPKASGGGSQSATPMKPSAPAAAPAKPAAKPMAAKKPMHHRHMAMRHHHMAMSSDDATTEQLNQQELARIQGGGMAPGGPAPGRMPGPKASPN